MIDLKGSGFLRFSLAEVGEVLGFYSAGKTTKVLKNFSFHSSINNSAKCVCGLMVCFIRTEVGVFVDVELRRGFSGDSHPIIPTGTRLWN